MRRWVSVTAVFSQSRHHGAKVVAVNGDGETPIADALGRVVKTQFVRSRIASNRCRRIPRRCLGLLRDNRRPPTGKTDASRGFTPNRVGTRLAVLRGSRDGPLCRPIFPPHTRWAVRGVTPMLPPSAFERHYRISELATLWRLGRETVRLLVKDEPGVTRARLGRKKAQTAYVVPASVAARIHRRLTNVAAAPPSRP